ncbi:MAG TPA: PIN domain-containing protein [Candidatus Bathyarchaeia archaeon]
MPKTIYDTRFLVELYYSKDEKTLNKLKAEKTRKEKYISTIVLHEVYKLTLAREGRQTAQLRTTLLEEDFKTVPVTADIAKASAELRHKYKISMGDSIIAATAQSLKATCISDDPHFQRIKEINTKWI